MNLFFEEDGAFKVGTEMSGTDSACQVELPTGKRIKVKRSHIFVTYNSPSPAEFLARAQQESEEIDLEILWEFAPDDEFDFKTIAAEYFGDSVTPIQQAATILRLHSNPVYFYRKGRGKYRKAPAETLKLALAAIERKKKLEEQKDAYVQMLIEEHKAPAEIANKAIELLVRPDKNSIEWKALNEASDKLSCMPLRLLLDVGAIPNAWRWHVESFFMINFPKGKNFPENLSKPHREAHDELPLSDAVAFSIDDSETTEIDDALSVTPLEDGKTRVGIHISAPGLGIEPGSDIDLVARERMSTVYAPGLKTTMLPKDWVAAFSLDEGLICPVVSLYAVVDNETLAVLSTDTRLERIKIEKNLRYDLIADKVTEEAIQEGNLPVPYGPELIWLWKFAKKLLKDREEVRGLTRRGEHGSAATFKLADLRGHKIIRGVLQTRVKVTGFLQVEELAHELARIVFPRGALIDRDLARLRGAGMIAALNASGFELGRHASSLFFNLGQVVQTRLHDRMPLQLMVSSAFFSPLFSGVRFVLRGIAFRDSQH